MLISIIVPVYNAQAYVTRCIRSLLHQTYTNIEVILVDDGSTDESYSICQQIAQEDSRLITFHQENQGVSAARNQGIKLASGKFIMFIDSDDYVTPDICEKLISASIQAQTVFGGYYFVHSQKGLVVKTEEIIPNCTQINSLNDFKSAYGTLICNKILLSSCAKLFSSDIIRKNHLQFQKNLHVGEDLVFVQDYLQALPELKISLVQQALYYYDIKENSSLSSRLDLTRFEGSRNLLKCMLDFCQNMTIEIEGAPYAALYYFRSCSVLISKLAYNSEQTTYVKQILQCPETKQALHLLPISSLEGLYYAIAFRSPTVILRLFIRLRQWLIRMLPLRGKRV